MDLREVIRDWGGISSVATDVSFSISKAYSKFLNVQLVVPWG